MCLPFAYQIVTRVDQVYIGNCSNGTMTDLRQAAEILRGRRVHPGCRAIVVPATQRIYREAMREGLLDVFVEAGASVSTPTCGACFGGHMGVLAAGERAVATTNRNFRGRMGSPDAEVCLANAYVAAAAAVAGELVDPADILAGAPA
jgi:3-isopropylmalate/(R)-2-methylmalate dehydratase large subunit